MRIAEIMTRRVVTIGMEETLATVRDMFAEYGFHHLLVVEKGIVVGVISDRDLLKHLSPFVGKLAERPQDVASLNKRVHQIMSRRLVYVRPDVEVGEAARVILEHRLSCLPVISDDARLLGIVTWRDLLRWIIDHGAASAGDEDLRDAA